VFDDSEVFKKIVEDVEVKQGELNDAGAAKDFARDQIENTDAHHDLRQILSTEETSQTIIAAATAAKAAVRKKFTEAQQIYQRILGELAEAQYLMYLTLHMAEATQAKFETEKHRANLRWKLLGSKKGILRN
jgi:predicted amidophosphoribosyltransferase